MAKPNLTQAKRNREIKRKERAEEKQVQRAQRKQVREERGEHPEGYDPDLEGIVPGPHNNPGERI